MLLNHHSMDSRAFINYSFCKFVHPEVMLPAKRTCGHSYRMSIENVLEYEDKVHPKQDNLWWIFSVWWTLSIESLFLQFGNRYCNPITTAQSSDSSLVFGAAKKKPYCHVPEDNIWLAVRPDLIHSRCASFEWFSIAVDVCLNIIRYQRKRTSFFIYHLILAFWVEIKSFAN